MSEKENGITHGASVVITGASSGMGRSLAIQLAKKYSARLTLNARSSEALEETRRMVETAGGEARVVPGNAANEDVQIQLIETAHREFGQIDVLVNNAGKGAPGPMLKIKPRDWEDVFALNFFAPLKLTYAVLPYFLKRGGGMIVNVSSLAGKVSVPGSVCYCASKFALTALSEGMASEFAGRNLKMITVCPGWVRTEFFEKNNMSDHSNPTLIASKNDLRGLVMRHLLSISSEQAAEEIVAAMEKNCSQEIVLTTPAVVIERLNGVAPTVVSNLFGKIPEAMMDRTRN